MPFGSDLIPTDSFNSNTILSDLAHMWNSHVLVMGPRGKEEFACWNRG